MSVIKMDLIDSRGFLIIYKNSYRFNIFQNSRYLIMISMQKNLGKNTTLDLRYVHQN
jgi:hypothetical protein